MSPTILATDKERQLSRSTRNPWTSSITSTLQNAFFALLSLTVDEKWFTARIKSPQVQLTTIADGRQYTGRFRLNSLNAPGAKIMLFGAQRRSSTNNNKLDWYSEWAAWEWLRPMLTHCEPACACLFETCSWDTAACCLSRPAAAPEGAKRNTLVLSKHARPPKSTRQLLAQVHTRETHQSPRVTTTKLTTRHWARESAPMALRPLTRQRHEGKDKTKKPKSPK